MANHGDTHTYTFCMCRSHQEAQDVARAINVLDHIENEIQNDSKVQATSAQALKLDRAQAIGYYKIMNIYTTAKLLMLIKKVMQLKDDQYIEDLTFKVMDQIEKEYDEKYAKKRSNTNNRRTERTV